MVPIGEVGNTSVAMDTADVVITPADDFATGLVALEVRARQFRDQARKMIWPIARFRKKTSMSSLFSHPEVIPLTGGITAVYNISVTIAAFVVRMDRVESGPRDPRPKRQRTQAGQGKAPTLRLQRCKDGLNLLCSQSLKQFEV